MGLSGEVYRYVAPNGALCQLFNTAKRNLATAPLISLRKASDSTDTNRSENVQPDRTCVSNSEIL